MDRGERGETMFMIINADDLGLSTTVNKAIFNLMAEGHVTSTSLLANAPATEEAIVELRRQKSLSFGVHLNVTEFHPLTKNAELSPILDSRGCFLGNSIRSTAITPRLREAIFQEWSAQINRLLGVGLTPSHIDSHHHVHTIPGLFFVLKRVQRRFGIRKVRISKNIYSTKTQASRSLLLRKIFWNAALRRYYPTITTSGFTSLADFFDAAQHQKIRYPSVELMVHPAGLGYSEETELLITPWRDHLPFEATLVSYGSLN
jgi:predicted glycoside hydrolase/deacetylase ChbG (UPF0249 family)